jgi:hypothetical protein
VFSFEVMTRHNLYVEQRKHGTDNNSTSAARKKRVSRTGVQAHSTDPQHTRARAALRACGPRTRPARGRVLSPSKRVAVVPIKDRKWHGRRKIATAGEGCPQAGKLGRAGKSAGAEHPHNLTWLSSQCPAKTGRDWHARRRC